MAGLVKNTTVIQVALVVKNIKKVKEKWAEFLDVPVPSTVTGGDYEITRTKYKGKAAPKANCKMAFISVGTNLTLELIEPNGKKSTWQDFLDKNGEGIHHVAFSVNGMDSVVKNCEKAGYKCVQRGKYGDGGGEYAYIDTVKNLKCVVELLESYSK